MTMYEVDANKRIVALLAAVDAAGKQSRPASFAEILDASKMFHEFLNYGKDDQ